MELAVGIELSVDFVLSTVEAEKMVSVVCTDVAIKGVE